MDGLEGCSERLHFHFSLSCLGEGNGNPLQCSCLENPRDGGAWWAAIYGVAQSWTRLMWLGSSKDAVPDSSVGKESTCNTGDPHSIPGLGRSSGEEKGYPLQYSGLENFMDYTVHGVAKSQTRLSDLHFTSQWNGKETPAINLYIYG